MYEISTKSKTNVEKLKTQQNFQNIERVWRTEIKNKNKI